MCDGYDGFPNHNTSCYLSGLSAWQDTELLLRIIFMASPPLSSFFSVSVLMLLAPFLSSLRG